MALGLGCFLILRLALDGTPRAVLGIVLLNAIMTVPFAAAILRPAVERALAAARSAVPRARHRGLGALAADRLADAAAWHSDRHWRWPRRWRWAIWSASAVRRCKIRNLTSAAL
jgi:hypothetical protein